LAAHLSAYNIILLGLDAAGINECEIMRQPLSVAINAVARYTRRILHDCDAPADDLVEKRGFSHVGAADHRYDRS
jgi:hypothetical protein